MQEVSCNIAPAPARGSPDLQLPGTFVASGHQAGGPPFTASSTALKNRLARGRGIRVGLKVGASV